MTWSFVVHGDPQTLATLAGDDGVAWRLACALAAGVACRPAGLLAADIARRPAGSLAADIARRQACSLVAEVTSTVWGGDRLIHSSVILRRSRRISRSLPRKHDEFLFYAIIYPDETALRS